MDVAGEACPDYRGGWIDRIDLTTGVVERLYEEIDGIRLAGPTDIVFDVFGCFWFTDFGKPVGRAVERGAICLAAADGRSVKRVIDGPRVKGNGAGRPAAGAIPRSMAIEASGRVCVASTYAQPGIGVVDPVTGGSNWWNSPIRCPPTCASVAKPFWTPGLLFPERACS